MILSNPFFEFKGSGKIVFDDGLSVDNNNKILSKKA
jgi:hypothetical protein